MVKWGKYVCWCCFLVDDIAGRPLFVNACNFRFVSLHGSRSCVHFTIKENCLMPPHFWVVPFSVLLICLFVFFIYDYLLWISKGWMGGGLTSFNISPAYFIMTLTMLEFYRGPHECVPCGCAHEYKICLLSGIMFLNHVHSVKRCIAPPPPPRPLETLWVRIIFAHLVHFPFPWCSQTWLLCLTGDDMWILS